jgi:hypothetical protein
MFGDCISITVVSVVATTTTSTVAHTIIDGTQFPERFTRKTYSFSGNESRVESYAAAAENLSP